VPETACISVASGALMFAPRKESILNIAMHARRLVGLDWVVAAAVAISVAGCSGAAAATATPRSAASSVVPATAAAASPAAPQATPAGVADAYPLLAGMAGHFNGTWNNNTFATTGSMTWDITANPADRTVQIAVNVGGNFFGGSGGPPETILLTHLAQGAIAGHSASFGDVSGTITPDGALHITLTNIPGGAISSCVITGTFTAPDSIAMDYTIDFTAGGTASGKVTLNRG
jgi:hypothetical protein